MLTMLLLPRVSYVSVCVCADHLNLMTANPLRGPNPPELGGPRFLDLSGEAGRAGGRRGEERGLREPAHSRSGVLEASHTQAAPRRCCT